MMQIVRFPARAEWKALLARPSDENQALQERVQQILLQVKKEGDAALRRLTKELHALELDDFAVDPAIVRAAGDQLQPELKAAIIQAKKNIEAFHQAQLKEESVMETMPGIRCWRRSVGIERVGLYIPGGTAPLFSTVLMLAVPAQLAGCREIVLCTPPAAGGHVHPAILFAAALTGVTRVLRIGGAQAIAAMAYGTETIPSVYKIFGPGNQYVTTAKKLVQMEGVAIDMPAGPSEVCVLADDSTDSNFAAADLLAQAEHGADSQVLLVSTDASCLEATAEALSVQLDKLPRKDFAARSLSNSKAILVRDMEEALELVNAYAAEHLIIQCRNADNIATRIVNAGSVFIGPYTPESVGDYASGTNHTLPTNGYAKAYSGVSVDSFVKKITFQQLTKEGLENIAHTVEVMAMAEGLDGHAEAVRVRRGK